MRCHIVQPERLLVPSLSLLLLLGAIFFEHAAAKSAVLHHDGVIQLKLADASYAQSMFTKHLNMFGLTRPSAIFPGTFDDDHYDDSKKATGKLRGIHSSAGVPRMLQVAPSVDTSQCERRGWKLKNTHTPRPDYST